MKITLQQLRLFVAVAQGNSMIKAAAALHISQSAISMGLAELESQLGKPLFDRIGKKLLLNSNGQKLLPKAQMILEEVIALPELLSEEETLTGTLSIGASTTIGNYLLPRLITQFITEYPEVDVKLSVNNTEHIISQVLKLQVDMGYIEGSCHDKALDILPWQKDELLIVASAKHPLTRIERLTWQDFAMAKWVLREKGSGTRERFLQVIGKHFSPQILFELGNSEAIKQALFSGAGLACLSRLVVQQELKTGALVALNLPGIHLNRALLQIQHHARYQNPLILAWQNFIAQS